MAVLDLNEAGPQGSAGVGAIPPKSMVVVRLHIEYPKQGMTGTYAELTRSNKSTLEYLATSLEVIEGTYKGAKIYHNFNVLGATTDKHKTAVNISKNQLRAIVENHRHIDPNDASPNAAQQRIINSYSEFEGMTFPIEVRCEASNKPKNSDPSHYYVRNAVEKVVTQADGEYATLCQPPYEIISALPVPEFPVNGGAPASAGGQQNLWGAPQQQAQPQPQTQVQAQAQAQAQTQAPAWGAQQAQATPPPAANPNPGTPAPAWAQSAPAAQPNTDQVPF